MGKPHSSHLQKITLYVQMEKKQTKAGHHI